MVFGFPQPRTRSGKLVLATATRAMHGLLQPIAEFASSCEEPVRVRVPELNHVFATKVGFQRRQGVRNEPAMLVRRI